MSGKRIGFIVGSLRRASFNKRLARAMESMAPDALQCVHIGIGDLPLYNQDQDSDPPEAAVAFKDAVAACDGVIFVTPEYNRSIPGVLKNALDHGSRPYGKSVWAGKPAGILGASVGAQGTAMAQQHLRCILAYLDMPVMTQPEAFLQVSEDYFGEGAGIADERGRKFVQKWVDAFAQFIKERLG